MSVASVGYSIPPVMPVELQNAQIHGVRQDMSAKPEYNAAASIAASNEAKPQIIESATKDLQRIGNAFNKKLQFEVDHQSNRVIVKVIDKDTDKVIRELPPEELQRLHQNLKEAIGLLFDMMV